MTDTAPEAKTTVSITVNGTPVEAEPGELVIAAAERAGEHIPRFCYHERMSPVGMCRMCLVDVDTGRGPMLQPSCMVPVSEGMTVDTESDATKRAQEGILEMLLVNHPLDCPVCDKGGECPLQDQTMAYGPGESRFIEEKRHYEKPIPISDLVHLDRERCILCDRCTRFADEVAGDPLIKFTERGNQTQVLTFPDDPFTSYFSGNTVQICPVGALTAAPYRFKARPWDLEQVESTCTGCSVGCRIAVQSSRDELVRYLGVDIDPVNHGWLCDKGRFGFEVNGSDARITVPLVRDPNDSDQFIGTSWGAALAQAADLLEQGRTGGIGVIGGARLANEDAYAWSKLARTVLGTDNVDAQLGDGLPAEALLGLPAATIDDACSADHVLVIGPDLKEELPVLFLRLKGAAQNGQTKIVELSPAATGLTPYVASHVPTAPGAAAEMVNTMLDATSGLGGRVAEGSVVVLLGRSSLAESAEGVLGAAKVISERLPQATFLPILRRGNVRGALDMGLAPGVLPGRVGLDEGRDWFEAAWGPLPAAKGLDTTGMLEAAVTGDISTLVLVGADPLADFPDAELVRRAFESVDAVIAIDALPTDSVLAADVVLPATMFGEAGGTTTNLEGRVSRLAQKVTAPGSARSDWSIAAELALRLGGDLGLESLEAIWDEIEAVAPSHAGCSVAVVEGDGARDGVLLPMPEAPALAEAESPHEDAADEAAGETAEADDAAVDAEVVDAEAADETAAEPEPQGPDRPALMGLQLADVGEVPPPDGYGLRLVSGRKLYDNGAMLAASASMAGFPEPSPMRVNPTELERLGVDSGAEVTVVGARATLVTPVVADSGVPQGTAVLAFDQPGPSARDLIDVNSRITDVRIETR